MVDYQASLKYLFNIFIYIDGCSLISRDKSHPVVS